MADNIITQVQPEAYSPTGVSGSNYDANSNVDYNSKIHLNIRGSEFIITRDELMSLPESILLCLFPNGVFLDMEGQVINNLTEDDIVFVNFDPSCFQYIIDIFSEAQKQIPEMATLSPQTSLPSRHSQENVLQHKPAIIVLREDLDYYVIPPIAGLDSEQIRHLKLGVSKALLENKSIFSGLGYDVDASHSIEQKLGSAEQHLFDMLCSSGFSAKGIWGSRSLEPSKCVISSLSLVRLKSTNPTPPASPALAPVTSNASSNGRSRSRIATLASSASRAASRSMSRKKPVDANQSKLLLFWRKPARKCWWSNQTIDVPIDESFKLNDKDLVVKVHIRRVWTLELSVIGVQ
ncbi:uncharacterized protein RJT21DRAFT_120673 [Scheffersomyces amazonensis]|uniref:uncharacterized protein n=1 Tax=Scheffersomyces amazonensis TaxID=1078765 RepID=UPI00315D3949